jgi:biotin operon repressor
MLDLLAIRKVLADLFDVRPRDVSAHRQAGHPEALVSVSGFHLLIAWLRTSEPGRLWVEWPRIQERARALGSAALPLVVVPFMGSSGRVCCQEKGIAWVDLCGNARVVGEGLRLLVTGQANRFARPGRPRTAFAPRSARVVRVLLEEPHRFVSQRELSKISGLNEGSTSRVVKRLEEDGYLVRSSDGKVRPRNTDLLLDAWDHEYQFPRHQVIHGYAPSPSGANLMNKIVGVLESNSVDHAATGLASAWLWGVEEVSDFRLVTLYVREQPSSEILDVLQTQLELSFQDNDAAANVWLVIPNDDGVFLGASVRDGVRTVHPVQVYLDLAAHPENASAAREHIRSRHLIRVTTED